jgi:hypothetical protein
MKSQLQQLALAAFALCLCGCAAPSSIKQTWKSPSYNAGPVQKVAVVAVEERSLLRQAFENRFARDLKTTGQNAMVTHDLMSLPEMKADKLAAAARFQEGGANTVLIIRLVDQATYANEVRATPALFVPTLAGYEYEDWYGYYTVAFTDMGTVWGNSTRNVFLDTSLFDLKSGQRLWSCQTLTVLKDETDRLAETDVLVAKIVAAMRKDGVVH